MIYSYPPQLAKDLPLGYAFIVRVEGIVGQTSLSLAGSKKHWRVARCGIGKGMCIVANPTEEGGVRPFLFTAKQYKQIVLDDLLRSQEIRSNQALTLLPMLVKIEDAEQAEATKQDIACLLLVAVIRAAAGDPEGKLMEDELVEQIRNLKAQADEAPKEIERLHNEIARLNEQSIPPLSSAEWRKLNRESLLEMCMTFGVPVPDSEDASKTQLVNALTNDAQDTDDAQDTE